MGQKKIKEAVADGKRDMTLSLQNRQNIILSLKEVFFGSILQMAIRFLPSILAGAAAGTAEYREEGNGMFLGKPDHTYQITHSVEGLFSTPVEHLKIRGLYVKHGEPIYRGNGVLHSLFGQIPRLNILLQMEDVLKRSANM